MSRHIPCIGNTRYPPKDVWMVVRIYRCVTTAPASSGTRPRMTQVEACKYECVCAPVGSVKAPCYGNGIIGMRGSYGHATTATQCMSNPPPPPRSYPRPLTVFCTFLLQQLPRRSSVFPARRREASARGTLFRRGWKGHGGRT